MILHIDLNSFFARAEQQTNPKLRNRPVGILGKGHKGARTCVCAASPEAKKFGVTSGSSTWEARRLCPQIILVPPDYPKYLDISRQFIGILNDTSPWVEIFSIDEAFVRVDGSLDEVLLAAQAIKHKMRQQLGELLTASIGVAWGKVFAKLAGELQKPDGLIVLEKDTWLDRVGEMPADELCGIGYQISAHLALLGIRTIRDLSRADAGLLVARFGPSSGMHLWQIGQGIDLSRVNPSRLLPPAKSIGHQVTLDHDWRLDNLHRMLVKLTQKVGRRLRRAERVANSLNLFLSLGNGGYWQDHQRYQPGIMTDAALLTGARALLERVNLPPWVNVRRVGIVAADLKPLVGQPLPLFPAQYREEYVTGALDQLRDRYGDGIIEWGRAFGTNMGSLRDWRGPRAVLDQ